MNSGMDHFKWKTTFHNHNKMTRIWNVRRWLFRSKWFSMGTKWRRKKKPNNNRQTKKAVHISTCTASNSVTAIDRNNAFVLSFYAGTHESMTHDKNAWNTSTFLFWNNFFGNRMTKGSFHISRISFFFSFDGLKSTHQSIWKFWWINFGVEVHFHWKQ